MKRTLRRESKAPETVGREAMDAGDPLLGAVCVARGGAWRAVANQYHKMECSCCVVRRASQGVRRAVGGRPSSSVCFPFVRCGCGPGFDGPAPVRLVAAGRGAFFQRARGWVSIPICEAGFAV
jgi:hypothetical protein